MTKEEFKAKLPYLEEWTGLSLDSICALLLRSSGFLEGVEGLKANPEISVRMNLNELKILQVMVRLAFSLQCQVLALEQDLSKQMTNTSEIKALLNQAQDEINHIREELNATKKKKRVRDSV